MGWWFKMKLWLRVLLALAAGIGFGFYLSETMGQAGAAAFTEAYIAPVGALFMRLIRMLIVPLIFTTLVAGILAMGDPKRLGSLGIKTILLYLGTTFFANIVGLVVGTVFKPGEGANLGNVEPHERLEEGLGLIDRLLAIVPENPVEALANGEVLAIIFFSVLLGIAILSTGDKGKPLGAIFESASDVVMKITHYVMEVAPFGVFALVATTTATQGLESFQSIAKLIGVVYIGLAIHAVITYGILVRIILNLPLVRFFRGIADAVAVAYSTSSSSATLPVTIACATDNLGIKKPVAGSVLPLGATINMDGTALYLGILALFTAQAFGYELSLVQYGLIALTASLASIGAAGIPSASLFLLAIVLDTFGVSDIHLALMLGLLFPVDRIMDMARTSVNVMGDSAVATAVAKWEGELDEETFKTPAKI
jgi:Na+/H+-dicarboxylate symporter